MNVVFCTTCKGRTEHLSRTLPVNLADNPDARFVVLNYNDQDGLAAYLQAAHAKDIASGQLAVYNYREPGSFKMAHAKNMAHRCGMLEGGDILVNLDADNYAGPGLARHIAAEFSSSSDIFLWSRMIKEGDGRLPKGISGRIAVSKTAFILAGGYDEKYETHSPDDKDFNARLRQLGFEAREIPTEFLKAILHNDKMRFREYRHAQHMDMGEESAISPEASVVNSGKIGCGVVFKMIL